MIKISKSDYVLGIKCLNALWFKKYRKDLETEKNQAVLDNGTAVCELACDRFPGGVRIAAKPWEDAAITQTKSAISGKALFIYEASLSTDTGEYCAVDILRNNNDGTWDIIEVKSTTEPHDYHYIDASFQRYVFTKCGINVRNCFIMTLNKEYVRTARAKGLTSRQIVYKHAGKNAIIPVITLASIQFIRLLGGTVIVETIFDYPGIGRWGVACAQQLDIAGILGFSLMVAALFVLGNLAADILYSFVDPRIRLK